ncbi:MAG: stage II sporulation protein P [Clostridiales bacterium]|jgi:stage II sporulation protein P|nr:stage II sporulation protein P [Clostridiales bacterium]
MLKSNRGRYGAAVFFITVITAAIIIGGHNIYREKWTIPESGEIRAFEDDEPKPLEAPFYPTFETVSRIITMEDKLEYLYTVDETAYVLPEQLDIQGFLKMDLSAELKSGNPKILIFHTHSRETFIDSRDGEDEDTVIGLGSLLANILADEFHIPVIHDVGRYDMENGKEKREGSYERMSRGVGGLLKKYPSIEITIDLHRDGVPDNVRLVQDINGVPTAKMMFFNGITCLNENGGPKPMPELPNPYLHENLALSLQLQLTANGLYPGLMRQIYIKPYRYSLFLKPKSMLVEVGANTNTVAEAMNAMRPLAQILTSVLQSSD